MVQYAHGNNLFSPVKAERLEVRAEGSGGLLEVVVRDLGEEEMMRHVTVGDVVVGVINAPAVRSVHRLHRRGCEVEVCVVKRLIKPAPPERKQPGKPLALSFLIRD